MSICERASTGQGQSRFATIGLAGGTVIVTLALSLIPRNHRGGIFGLIIIAAVGLSVIGHHVAIISRNLLVTGPSSGSMETMAGIHDPPIACLYQRATGENDSGHTDPLLRLLLHHFHLCLMYQSSLWSKRASPLRHPRTGDYHRLFLS
jgi:hypothetical protein